MVNIIFYNTLTRSKEPFVPLDPKRIGLYVCGPTVYDFAHLGNARPVVVFDVLYRLLRYIFPTSTVCYIRNITDVDDKINAAAASLKEDIASLTARTTQAYHQDMQALGALPPNLEPHATHHVDDMIGMIATLIQREHAYVAEKHVLFSVESFSDYGCLSRRKPDELLAGARVEVAPYKHNPVDFVLWKPSEAETVGWESPWGRGRPGWHIECSAMSHKYLGIPFDIHGGGQDLIFPHHENEIAQSCCTYNTALFARFFLHNGHLTVGSEKMSKSLGNVLTVRDLLKNYPGEAIRLALLSTHYRHPLDWSDFTPQQAKQRLDHLYLALRPVGHFEEREEADPAIISALADDLNIPLALSHLHHMASELNQLTVIRQRRVLAQRLRASAKLLGFLQQSPEEWFHHAQSSPSLSHEAIESFIRQRTQARKNKDFAEADRLRAHLLKEGIILEDTPQGTLWRCQ